MSTPANLPWVTVPANKGVLNTGSKAGNIGVRSGIGVLGSMIPIPGAGTAAGYVGTGLTTGDWSPWNLMPFGLGRLFHQPQRLLMYAPLPNDPGSPNFSWQPPSVNSKNFIQGLPQMQNFSAAPNFSGDPMALLQYVAQNAAMNSNYGIPTPAQGAKFTGLNNPQQFAPAPQQPNYIQQGTPYQSGFASQGSIPAGFWNYYDNGWASGGGGGGGFGGSGSCFSGNTELDGLGCFDSLPLEITLPDGRKATVIVHDHDGPMRDMGNGELVTLDHPMLSREGALVPASDLFSAEVQFKGKVYNLHVHTEQESERYYRLKNGWVAHNKEPLIGIGAQGWFA